jgi:ankyrin repeat protein
VRLLLDKGANIESKNKHGWTPLSQAAMNGYEAVVKLLLDRGANIECNGSEDGRTPLSQVAVVKLLLDKGTNVESRDNSGWTPLLYAVASDHEALVNILLNRGVDFESKGDVYGLITLFTECPMQAQ